MSTRFSFGSLLLLSTMLVAPAALAQTPGAAPQTPPASPPSTTNVDPNATDEELPPEEEEAVEISAPGAEVEPEPEEVVVTGRATPNVVRNTPQVVNVLSAADIARTGEGDIAGALQRVTGLSVVGNGFVFVRGLGDRYSSALLNGSPLPSPEPLRRTVPLDIFPTTVVGSALVQKTYSVNYPAEFGGGVINLTTKAIPRESFLSIGGGIGVDTITTDKFGYVYDGGNADWTGYDTGTRNVPSFVREVGFGGTRLDATQTAQLSNLETVVLQQTNDTPPNYSAEISFGHSVDAFGDAEIGVIGSASFSNGWRTRDAIQQDTNATNGALRSDFRSVITDNRAVANALIGLGLDFGDNKIRFTNVYIHDTLKQARGSSATIYPNTSGFLRFEQNTRWFARELFDSQLVGEFDFGDFEVDARGSYANVQRESPFERSFVSRFDPDFGAFVNALNASSEQAQVSFSDLDEDQWSGQLDLSYRFPAEFFLQASAGYFYSDTDRVSDRFTFSYRYDPTGTGSAGALPLGYRFLRPDLLLSPTVLSAINSSLGGCPNGACIVLENVSGGQGASVYDASLRIHAGYAQLEAEPIEGLRATIGVRYETAKEEVITNAVGGNTSLDNDYFLPAATITYDVAQDMQLRLHGSKTIARPQFRELAPQFYQDFDSDRLFFGNPSLVDSELLNFEARFEWFFGRNERFTAAGFYKKIDNPIEQVSFFPTADSRITTGFSFVPEATLYGGEVEVQKYFDLDSLGGAFFSTRRLILVGNYTYTNSEITADDTVVPDINSNPVTFRPANLLFRDGAPLTGQSDHLVNLQIGIEDTETTSQATLLFNYASERVTARGASNISGVGFLPDVVEEPGIRLDLVVRQGFELLGKDFEFKFEARNLTGTRYNEFQSFDAGDVFINRYDLGRTFSIGVSATL